MKFCVSLLVLVLAAAVQADVYLHNFRGSNNRLDEARRDRNNANRLFDSQNNNRGGSNVGNMYFYEGEKIPLEWSVQHGCGSHDNDCQLVFQYMCSDHVRDGATTRTIPDQPSNCLNNDCNNDVRYGMHETYDYYQNCRSRVRNKGLFTADRNLNGQSARFTRQNERGTRRGYECPEERDHYPYWHPTPWIDVAILTNDGDRCDWYRAESENVKGRYHCRLPDSWYHHRVSQNANNVFIPNNKIGCENQNAPGSQMVTFLSQEATKGHRALQTIVQQEVDRCLAALSACDSLTGTANTTCRNNFRAGGVSEAAIQSQVPICGSDGVWSKHPYSDCNICIKSECATKSNFHVRNMTAFNATNGCKDGFLPDLNNNMYCITSDCYNETSSFEQAQAVDTARTELLIGKYVIPDDPTDFSCPRRETLSATCFTDRIPKAVWEMVPPHNTRFPWAQAPMCTEPRWSRVNHHGNAWGGFWQGFNYTFPSDYRQHCVFRMRYNITTSDYAGLNPHNGSEVNASYNKNNGNNNPAKIPIRSTHKIPMIDSTRPYENARGYLFEQNPQVQIFDFDVYQQYCAPGTEAIPDDPTRCITGTDRQGNPTTAMAPHKYCPYPYTWLVNMTTCMMPMDMPGRTDASATPKTTDDDFELQLAINTNQFGRTFQDRTHSYSGRQRSDALKDKCDSIYALNVRGKRGNIVQTYPGTEYDFVPNRLHVAEGDCIHFQWTGSNTNPNNNDGQGKQGTDRSNIALLEYVRGEGGRGVYSFGGKGADGTTWTTKGMEPGWESFNFEERNERPTMADMACPPASDPEFSTVHPVFWKFCTKGRPTCVWSKKPANGECPDGTVEDTFDPRVQNTEYCVTEACAATRYAARPANPASSWTNKWNSDASRRQNSLIKAPNFLPSDIAVSDTLKRGQWGMSHPEHLDNVTAWGFLGLSRPHLVNLATLDNIQYGGEMSELDDAGTYFDLPVHKATGKGTYFYLCTRNNNFSNRSQKGKIVVTDAPENEESIGTPGGFVSVTMRESFTGVPNTEEEAIGQGDFWIQVPPKAMTSATQVKMNVMESNDRVGLGNDAASEMLWVGPTNLATNTLIPDFTLTAEGANRRDTLPEDIWVSLKIINASAIWFRIRSDGFEALAKTSPNVTLIFKGKNFNVRVPVSFDANNELEGMWTASSATPVLSAYIREFEQGTVVVGLDIDGDEYSGTAEKDPESGQPLIVRMPVSVTLTYGSVYFWPDTLSGRDCITDKEGCAFIRRKVKGAKIDDGEAVFEVGASQTEPAGGFYQVSAGNNLPLIVGVTVACVLVALAAVGAAVYFRKHPDKWENAKSWGPRKYKSLSRSFANQV
eukprot:m.212749 g.212749  ORF g.212749 m.212749 type:complete len:1339 (+) comp26162_c0_seq2:104-4120(+)